MMTARFEAPHTTAERHSPPQAGGRRTLSPWGRTATLSLVAGAAQGIALAAENQSALRPAGVQAQTIFNLWNGTLWLCTVVFAAVLAALLWGLMRGTRAARRSATTAPHDAPAHEPGPRRWVFGATVLCGVLLAGLLATDVLTDRSLSRLPAGNALQLEMIGHQWWWETRYRTTDGTPAFGVSSDLHVPVGRPVVVTLQSSDVIHTFWVPNLHGKKDMLPGRTTTIAFQADRPGDFRGQCAEFCGAEHALMAFGVRAEPPEAFAAWQAAQQATAAAPASAEAQRGQKLFMQANCAQCHTVRGTAAAGTLGPDLTHLASRPMIAAGTATNDRTNLLRWVRNPQSLKPSATMPPAPFGDDDVALVVSYLEGLK
ncbi:MAG: cytochrome c oxidase, subunit [Rhodoferax sp.]|nr:cytochrome c oxidase, subunit [Rhodoferax sp.]